MGIETATLVLIGTAITAATTVHGAVEAQKAAKKQRRAKTKQAMLQQRLEVARTKRRQRIRAAEIAATMGTAGVGGSVLEAPLVSAEVQERGQIEILGKQTALQVEQFGAEYSTTAAQAEAQIGQAIGAFTAATAAGMDEEEGGD